jgi:dihydropteroate synthase
LTPANTVQKVASFVFPFSAGRHVPAERDLGTAAACVAAVAQGADIVRVHNVPVVAEALRVADGVFRGTWPILEP